MIHWLSNILAPPVFEDKEKTRVAHLLNSLLVRVLGVTLVLGAIQPLYSPDPALRLMISGIVILLEIGGLIILRRGHVRLVSNLLPATFWLILSVATFFSGGVRTPSFATFTIVVLIASLFSGGWVGVGYAVLSGLAGLGFLYGELHGLLPTPIILTTPASMWVGTTINFLVAGLLLNLTTRSITNALNTAHQHENKLLESNLQFQAQAQTLERREAALQRANRAYRAISDCNQLIVRATDEFALLQSFCRVFVEVGEYRLAWIGYADPSEDRQVRPVAKMGFEDGYLETVNITWEDTPQGQGPTGKAIRTGKPVCFQNLLTNPEFTPWREEAIKRGYAASIALPLKDQQGVFGTFNIYAAEPEAFDEEEIKLLSEIAENLSYGVQSLRTQSALRKSEQQVREQFSELDQLYQTSPIGMALMDTNLRFVRINEKMAAINGKPINEHIDQPLRKILPELADYLEPIYHRVIESGAPELNVEIRGSTPADPDVEYVWLSSYFPLKKEDTETIGGVTTVVQDITARKQSEDALKASETSLKEAQKLAQLGSYELELETLQLEWSEEMYHIHGIQEGKSLIGDKDLFDTIIHPEDRERVWQDTQSIIQTGKPGSSEFRIVRPDGNVRYVQGESQLKHDNQGNPTHLIGTVQDITERKLTELAVQRTADRLQIINEIDQAVLTAQTPTEIARTSLQSIRRLIPCEHAGVVLFDQDSNRFNPLAADFDPDIQFVDISDQRLKDSVAFSRLERLLREEKIYITRDKEEEPLDLLPMTMGQLEAQSGILAAMIDQGKLIGALNLLASEPNYFTAEHIEIALEIADSLAIAIQNSRLAKDQRRYTEQLESLRQASLQLTSNLNLEPVLETVLEYALSLVSALDAHIFLYDGALITFGAARWADNRSVQPFKEVRSDGITYTVARTGERIVIPDVDSHSLFQDWQWGGAIIGLPLSKAEKVIGVMTVAFEEPHRFKEDEIRILELLADQASIAIDNARLYTSESTERRNVAALAASARDLSAELDQDHLLQLTLDRLQEVVPYDRATLSLIKNGRPEFVAIRGFEDITALTSRRDQIGGVFPLEKTLMETRAPLIIPDVTQDPGWEYADRYQDPKVRSWLGVPVITGEQVLGLLMLDNYEAGFYSEDAASLAAAFTAHVAIAIQNAQLFEDEHRKSRQLEGLHQLSLEITAQLDPQTLLETTAQYAIDLLGGKSGGLYLYQPDRDVIEWTVAIGPSLVPLGSTLKKGEGLSGKIWTSGEPLIVGDYINWEGRAEVYEGYPWRSVIGAPISRGGTFYGILNVLSDEVDAFSDADKKVLDLFITQAAIALENARFFESLNRRNHELAMLFDLGQRLTRQLDLGTLLQTVATAIVTTIAAVEAASVWLLEPEKNRLAVHGWNGFPDEVMKGLSIPTTKSLIGHTFTTAQAKIFQDAQNDPLFEKFNIDPVDDVVSVMCVPLIFEGQTIGAMVGDNFTQKNAFSDNDLQLIQSLGGAASIAIQNARLFDSVNLQSFQLRDLTNQLADLAEMERKQLAQELHDRVGQNLTALSINLNMVKSFLPAEAPPTLDGRLEDSLVLIEETAQHIRDVMSDLRPPVLDDYGLFAALRWYGDQFAKRTGINVSVHGENQDECLPLGLATTLFRIAQEALTNISRHANAQEVRIDIKAQPGDFLLVIADDGKGFLPENVGLPSEKSGWGLQIMKERVESINGDLQIESHPELGTVVRVRVQGDQI